MLLQRGVVAPALTRFVLDPAVHFHWPICDSDHRRLGRHIVLVVSSWAVTGGNVIEEVSGLTRSLEKLS